VQLHIAVEKAGQTFFGQVVPCGAKPSGDQNNIGSSGSLLKGVHYRLNYVADGGRPDYLNAGVGKRGGYPLTVGIYNVTIKDFVSDGNYFCGSVHKGVLRFKVKVLKIAVHLRGTAIGYLPG